MVGSYSAGEPWALGERHGLLESFGSPRYVELVCKLIAVSGNLMLMNSA